ncbi:hypothetical protein [Bradyrhizobium sp. SZCCHNR1093]|uniref:hypothetical protein n=1 Tax=Bradyrhizobium sp. SZCCHNR1093 TaxID=3057368 RepID=UPI0028E35A38|nr:hypothetical protein [Bradyrhizobium sp. SZCCHNR1093]
MTIQPNRVRFIDATHRQCKFFLPGESGMEGFVCGDPTGIERSFCDCHHRRCFKLISPVSRTTARYDDQSVCEVEIDEGELELTELVS